MVMIYAFHGTNEQGYLGIGDADASLGGYVDNFRVCESSAGDPRNSNVNPHALKNLGKGIYATTCYRKAREHGEYIYIQCRDSM
jgi:hypothetical protein